jgi:aryl-alcohol dehydrogenase-like predicted oxidoreductase
VEDGNFNPNLLAQLGIQAKGSVMTTSEMSATVSGTFALGGDLTVHRLGYGTMQLPGPGVWGEPGDRGEAIRVLRRAVEVGVDLFDTADSYGPFVAEDLLREALYPYEGITIATKGGLVRTGPGEWYPVGRPEYLRQCMEMSLRRLGVETIDLYQLHRIDPQVPLEDQIGALAEMQSAGKVRHIGLSEVSVDQIRAARQITEIASVQNRYNLVERTAEAALEYCEHENLGFIPWFPLANRGLVSTDSPLAALAAQSGATPTQLALAWLLWRSPVMLPIPGTNSLEHLEENVSAAALRLTDEQAREVEEAK